MKKKLKYEEKVNDLMIDLTKIVMNLLYRQSIGKDIDEENVMRSEKWLLKNSDGTVVEYEPLPNGEYVSKNKADPRN